MTLRPMRRCLQWLQYSLALCAAALLGYCGYAWFDASQFQRSQSHALDRQLTLPASARTHFATGQIGRLDIPRLGISVMVLEGTSHKTLRRALGHIQETVLPGQPGNIGISGHRDTFLRPLRNVRKNDVITLTTPDGEYRYRVVSTKIVNPSDMSVLESGTAQVMTLVTCYPFYFVGEAPERFIVRANRVV